MAIKDVEHATESTCLITKPSHKDEKGDFWATVKLIAMSSAGLFADGWDLQVINLVLAMLAHLYPDQMTPKDKSLAAAATLVGVIVGQLSFGVIADIIGRKLASITTAVLTVAGVVASACVGVNGSVSLALAFSICRFVAGLGIGGEYPVTAAITKEAMSKNLVLSRQTLLIINMAMVNFGMCAQSILVLILLSSHCSMEVAWRVAIVGGAVPSLIAAFLRLSLEEPEAPWRTEGAPARRRLVSYANSIRDGMLPLWRVFLGACLCWGIFNFSAYGQGTFASTIVDRLLAKDGEDEYTIVKRDAVFAFLTGCCSLLGTFIALWLSHLSLKINQMLGFGFLAVCMFACQGTARSHDQGGWLSAVFLLLSVSMNGLLGVTTYLVPTQSFPAATRTTVVGFASASGKVGAAIGCAIFPIMEHSAGLPAVLLLAGILAVVAFFITALLTPDGSQKSEPDGSQKSEPDRAK